MLSKRTKLIAMMMSSVLVAGTLYGCGSSDSNSGSSGSDEEKTLTVWSHLTEQEVKDLQPIVEKWGKENNVKVNLTVDNSEFQQYVQAAQSSKGPDVVFGQPNDNLGTYEKAGLLAEVPSGTINDSDYTSKQVIEAGTINGKQYAVPLAQETIALYYNTEKVKEAPKTIDDLINEAKKVGFEYDINNFYNSFAFVAANGGYVFKDKDGTLDKDDIGLGNEGAIKGYQFIQDLVQKDKFMKADITGDIAKGDFSSGKTGFYISGPWDVPAFKDSGVKFDVAPLPTMNGKPIPSFMGVQTAFVSAKSKNQEIAWKFVKDIAKEGAMTMVNVGNRIPVLNSVIDSKEFKDNKFANAFLEQTKYAIPMPNIPAVQAMWKPAEENLKLLNSGKIDANKCGELIVNQMKEGIAQQK